MIKDTTWIEWVATEGREEIIATIGYDPYGCENCKFGFVSEPDLSHIPGSTHLKRCIAASLGAIIFCECKAGQSVEHYIGERLKWIPANMLRPGNRLIYLRLRDDDTAVWQTGSSPQDYIAPSFIQAVYDAVNAPPTVHGAEEDIF